MKTQALKRMYPGKDVSMLTTCASIIKQAIKQQPLLVVKRPKWIISFFTGVETRIDNAFKNILGIDNAKEMRQATQVVHSIQENALTDLSEFKVQIEEDFKDNKIRRQEILTNLGFNQHYKQAQKQDQQALVDLLFQIKLNMTDELKTEITEAGTAETSITGIIGYAEQLKNSNITQETLKTGRKELSQAGVTELNAIYSEVISIARIAARFFKADQAIKDQFSYAKTLKNL